jgi:hypothetical protein
VWIVQEIILTRSFRFLAPGPAWLDNNDLNTLVVWLWHSQSLTKESMLSAMSHTMRVQLSNITTWLYRLHNLHCIRRQVAKLEGYNPQTEARGGHPLSMVRPLKATDPRDMIYGFHGLCNMTMEVDCCSSVASVYTRAAEELLTMYHPEEHLQHAAVGDNDKLRDPDLPTWVRDPRVPEQLLDLRISDQIGAGWRAVRDDGKFF